MECNFCHMPASHYYEVDGVKMLYCQKHTLPYYAEIPASVQEAAKILSGPGTGQDLTWHLEDKHTGAGATVHGSFVKACRKAVARCNTDGSVCCVWKLPENIKVAEASMRGIYWLKEEYKNELRQQRPTEKETTGGSDTDSGLPGE